MPRPISPPVTSIPTSSAPHLQNLDINGDKKIDRKDFKELSDDQFAAVMMAANASTAVIQQAPMDLKGKKVLFTALKNLKKSDASRMAKEAGAAVSKTLTQSIDVLVVGNSDKTTKDEKAIRLNASGQANIVIMTEAAFMSSVNQATAKPMRFGNDDGSGPRTTIEAEHYDDDTGREWSEAFSFSDELLGRVNTALRDFVREYFEDSADYWDSRQEWEDAVNGLEVGGWIAHESEDPIGFDLETEFVFTAYDDELTGDHGLFVTVDKATGKVTYATEFN